VNQSYYDQFNITSDNQFRPPESNNENSQTSKSDHVAEKDQLVGKNKSLLEKKNGKIVIRVDEFSKEAFSQILSFVYTDKVNLDSRTSLEIISAREVDLKLPKLQNMAEK
jgi:hypothetical protein